MLTKKEQLGIAIKVIKFYNDSYDYEFRIRSKAYNKLVKEADNLARQIAIEDKLPGFNEPGDNSTFYKKEVISTRNLIRMSKRRKIHEGMNYLGYNKSDKALVFSDDKILVIIPEEMIKLLTTIDKYLK